MTAPTEALVDISAARDEVHAMAVCIPAGPGVTVATIPATHRHVAAWAEELASSQARIERIKALAKQLEARELAWQQNLARIAGGVAVSEKAPRWTLPVIEQFVTEHARGKTRYVDTVAGRIQLRAAPASVHLPKENEERLIAWARKEGHEEVLAVEVRVRLTELRNWIETTGELPCDEQGTIAEFYPAGRYSTVHGSAWKTPPVVVEEKEAIEEETP